ncbi:DUF4270 family protein [Catalinimonas sp. 4WD22]|uniref:DUF4270 family protein n=1 Tax=Catalinimonas locisalis TaxID=3133978 RepID=UPI003100FC0B
MNWLTKGKFGLIALSALFLSCENDDLLSLDFDPQDENINLSFTELTLPFQLIQRDSIRTSYTSNMLVGNYLSDDFGKVEAISYMTLGIGSRREASTEDELDSLVLTFTRNYFYGSDDESLEQTVNIHQLREPVIDSLTYYTSSSLAYDPNALGSLRYTVNPESNDTLSVRLSEAMGNELLDKIKNNAAELDSSRLFTEYFKGLALISPEEKRFITGFSPNSLRMNLYFSSPADTVSKVFSFGIAAIASSPNSTLPLSFYHINYDRSGTALANIDQPREVGSATDNRFYLQASSGIVPRIDFQPLVNFVAENPNRVLLNRVILHIGLSEPEETKPAPAALFGYQLEDDGISRVIEFSRLENARILSGLYNDENYRYDDIERKPFIVGPSPIRYDTTNIAYNEKVTSFAQNLIDGFVDNPAVLIQPNDFTTGFSQLVTEADSIKLRVYYTTLK